MKKNSKGPVNILFCGTGGQGVLKAAEVCGVAAMLQGYHVKKSEVHGMAQRGGSVESHLRFGAHVFSPLIPRGDADYLVSFWPDESKRLSYFLKKGGVDLTGILGKTHGQLQNPRFLNTFVLGALSKHLLIDESNWIKAFESVFAGKHFEENVRIFRKAREMSS